MSYSRAWQLVNEMNRQFREPLVEACKGGASHGGATLSRLGEDVLQRYRRLEAGAERAAAPEFAALQRSAAAKRRE